MAVKKGQRTKDKGQTLKVKSRSRRVHGSLFTVRGFKVKLQFVFSIFLILSGVALIGYAASKNFDFNIQQSNNPTTQQLVTTRPQFSKIKSVNIPKIERDLAVSDGKFENGRWEVATEGISFYTGSALPEAGGNTVLYGHNKARILGGLTTLKKGDKIELALANGKMLPYEVMETKTIKPTDVSILSTSTDTILTIYTCSGFLDTSRFVVLAKPVAQ